MILGISTYGFRMVIQLLAKMKPEIILKDIPKVRFDDGRVANRIVSASGLLAVLYVS